MESSEQWKQLNSFAIGNYEKTTWVYNLPTGVLVVVSNTDEAGRPISETTTFVSGLIAVEISKSDKVILLPIESLSPGLKNSILSSPDKIAAFLNEQFNKQQNKDKKLS
jgi:hypothetical protein